MDIKECHAKIVATIKACPPDIFGGAGVRVVWFSDDTHDPAIDFYVGNQLVETIEPEELMANAAQLEEFVLHKLGTVRKAVRNHKYLARWQPDNDTGPH